MKWYLDCFSYTNAVYPGPAACIALDLTLLCMYIHTKTIDVDDDIVLSLPVLMKAPTVNAIRGKRKYGVISRNRLPLPYNATSLFFV